MKKLLIALAVMFAATVFNYSCTPDNINQDEKLIDKDEVVPPGDRP